MREPDPGEDVAAKNEGAIEELAFGLEYSQGQFKLILARCNYAQLRARAMAQLEKISRVSVSQLQLSSTTQTLFHSIRSQVNAGTEALSVWGFEEVRQIDRLLSAANQVREEFRKHFPFPIILWIDDEILQKLIRLAPDFESWATIVEFAISASEPIALLEKHTARVFEKILGVDSHRWLMGRALMKEADRREFHACLQDVRDRNISLTPELMADVDFVLGRNAYERDELDTAIVAFDRSLSVWQQTSSQAAGDSTADLHQGILWLHLGLCHFRTADLRSSDSPQHWQQARDSLQNCIEILETTEREDLVARFISYLAEALRYLEDWAGLKAILQKSVPLHRRYGSTIQLAADYGLLAECALGDGRWLRAERSASAAVQTLQECPTPSLPYHSLLELLYRLFLVKAQFALDRPHPARENLARAVQELPQALASSIQCDPHRSLRILELLCQLYFERGCYLEAFEIKLKRRAVEVAFGLRAFIGAARLEPHREAIAPARDRNLPDTIAPEIRASGRGQDVKRLLERVGRPDRKLTILYGPSGVGKSSIVHAGLIPALAGRSIDVRDAIPVVVRVYGDWPVQLGKALTRAMGIEPSQSDDPLLAGCFIPGGDCLPGHIIEQLQRNIERNVLTVIIFEQFEEFFFSNPNFDRKREFYEFLDEILNIPYVKVIISIREDYLHHLLEIDRTLTIPAIDGDILSRKSRYFLGNLSKEDAHNVIESLTEISHFHLEPQLVDRLVEDLAGDLDRVRPIELQIVGAQLQTDKIDTLEKYLQSGTLPNLIERFIEEAIHDCGPQNEQLARLVLYHLTDENGMRPLQTRAELERDLNDLNIDIQQLPLVLEILKKAGLVFFLPEVPHHRYQLVHDYLVPIIRQREELAREAETIALREQNKLLVQLAQVQQEKERAGVRLKGALVAILAGTLVGALIVSLLWQRAARLQKDAAISSIVALNAASKSLRLSDERFDALVASVRAGKQFQQLPRSQASPHLKSQTLNQLQLALYGITERNRLEKHTNSVLEVSFSGDGQWIATASADRTAKIWRPDGSLVRTIEHPNEVNSITFSPDSRTIATVSGDEVRLWSIEDAGRATVIPTGNVPQAVPTFAATPTPSTYTATRVRFSPNGQLIATAHTEDNTVKLWQTDGTLVRVLEGHRDWVLDVSFSPDGQTLASASLDETVKVWDIDGGNLATLPGHDCGPNTPCGVTSVEFSPDGTRIATASQDKTVKLWQRDGTFIRKLKNDAWVWDVSFSPDGQILAIASRDNTVRLRTLEGEELQTLRGHQKQVRSVSFSADGQTIASASDDNTIVLWDREGEEMPVLEESDRLAADPSLDDGNPIAVFAVAFSEDGKIVASGNADKTVKLWDRRGNLLQTLEGHQGAVNWVGWSPDGEILASASADGNLKLWRSRGTLDGTLNHGRGNPLGEDGCLLEATPSCPGIESASFSADNRLIATAGGRILKLWNRNGSRRQTFVMAGEEMAINSVAFAPDGEFLVTGHDDRTVRIWNLGGELLTTLRGHGGAVRWVTLSPDGKIIASASSDKTVKLWRPDGTELATLAGHIAPVNWVSFSGDGTTLASASDAVKLWQLDEELENPLLTTLEDDRASVWSVSFSGDGRTLASSRADGTVVLWNLDFDDLLDRGCNWIEDYLKVRNDGNICD